MTRIRFVAVLIVGGLLLQMASSATNVAQPPDPDQTPPVSRPVPRKKSEDDKAGPQVEMRAKLAMVQKIVEGISTEDFDMVEAGATELVTLAESAAWKSSRDPYYRHYSGNFEQAARGLIDAAKRESVEKSTFAYVHVTFSCTACHQHVRSTIRTAR